MVADKRKGAKVAEVNPQDRESHHRNVHPQADDA